MILDLKTAETKSERINMYVTRPLSGYQKDPSMLSLPPPEGPSSGILVILDKEAEPTKFFGLFKGHELQDLPFPQNKDLKLRYSSGENTYYFYTAFIPVLNQPLASNCYYAISSRGKHKGQAYTSSTEEDLDTCCFSTYVREVPPQPFSPSNILQQFQIQQKGSWNQIGGFVAKSITSDGFPPKFLGRKGWEIYISTPHDFRLDGAPGLDSALRARLPDFNFVLSNTSSKPVVVGNWYCPFIFIKEGSLTLKDQMSRTRYYDMSLEQSWEQIFACDYSGENNAVVVDVCVENEFVAVAGNNVEDVHEEMDLANGVMWYKGFNKEGGESCVGMSLAILERVKWEQQRFGWNGVNERKVKVKKVEEFQGMGGWKKFVCYVLVERFVLKRMDGSLLLTYGFRHTQHIRSKWV